MKPEDQAQVGEDRAQVGIVTGAGRGMGAGLRAAAEALDTVGAIAAAGVTWWLEGFRPQPGEHDAARDRIEAGPPR